MVQLSAAAGVHQGCQVRVWSLLDHAIVPGTAWARESATWMFHPSTTMYDWMGSLKLTWAVPSAAPAKPVTVGGVLSVWSGASMVSA